VAAALSDKAWAETCKAAELTPDAKARSALATLLFEEYPAFAYDRERWATAYQRSERMLKQFAEFAELYRQAWVPHLSADEFQAIIAGRASPLTERRTAGRASVFTDMRTEADLWCLKVLWQRPEATWLAARAIRHANKGRKSPQREWLYHRLCGIWLDHFNGQHLSFGRPGGGGKPKGPLIAFLLVAMRQVIAQQALPDPEALAEAIVRERQERERARQLHLFILDRLGD
jgi:hypothetical protein